MTTDVLHKMSGIAASSPPFIPDFTLFRANLSSNTSDIPLGVTTQVIFDNVLENPDGAYNGVTGEYTVPVNFSNQYAILSYGVYCGDISNLRVAATIQRQQPGSGVWDFYARFYTECDTGTVRRIVPLLANQKWRTVVFFQNGTGPVFQSVRSFFDGILLKDV